MIIYSWSWLGHSFVYHCTSFVPADESTNNSVNWLVDHFQGQVCSFSLIRIVNYQRIPPPFCSIYNHSTDWDSRRWRRPDAVAVLCDNHFLVPHREECVIKLTSNRHPSIHPVWWVMTRPPLLVLLSNCNKSILLPTVQDRMLLNSIITSQKGQARATLCRYNIVIHFANLNEINWVAVVLIVIPQKDFLTEQNCNLVRQPTWLGSLLILFI